MFEFLFKTMQLACFWMGFGLIGLSIEKLYEHGRSATIEMKLSDLAFGAIGLGAAAISAFWQRLNDGLVYYLGWDMVNEVSATFALFLYFMVMGWFVSIMLKSARRAMAVCTILLVGCLGLTGLETFQ